MHPIRAERGCTAVFDFSRKEGNISGALSDLVAINDAPYFPGAVIQPEVKAEVMKRFPQTTLFGIFQVFWKH